MGIWSAVVAVALAVDAGSGPSASPVAVSWLEGFSTPESVLWEPNEDVYYVSNINGTPLQKDNNGYISKLSPDGKVIAQRWADCSEKKKNCTLNAPKGMAVLNGKLYVADIDAVRVFDLKKGKAGKSIVVPGATFLNDVATDGVSQLFFSDSGMREGAAGFEPTGTDAVYGYDVQRGLKKLASGTSLERPNGLAFQFRHSAPLPGGRVAGLLWMVPFGGKRLSQWEVPSLQGLVQTALPAGAWDGLIHLGRGNLLLSSWETETLYRGNVQTGFKPVVVGVKAPADIGYDSKRERVLVPRFMENRVEAYDLR